MGLRLFANLCSGHLLLIILSFFLNNILTVTGVSKMTIALGILFAAIVLLELFINFIQG